MTTGQIPGGLHAAVGWVHQAGYTLRWRRGDARAYVFHGVRECPDSGEGAIDSISVNPGGWTDLAQMRRLLHCWLEHNNRNNPPPRAVAGQPKRGGRTPGRGGSLPSSSPAS